MKFLARLGQDDDGDGFPSVTDDQGRRVILGLVAGGVDLVILDNLSTLGDVDDENNASDWNALQATLLALKRAGVAVVVVHHARKNGDTYRGSSKLGATMDVVLGLERNAQWSAGEARFTLRWEKLRASGKDLREITVRLATDAEGRAEWRVEDGGRLGEVKRLLMEGRFATQDALAAHFGVDPSLIRREFKRGAELVLWDDGWPQQALKAAKAGEPIPLPRGAGGQAGRRGTRRADAEGGAVDDF